MEDEASRADARHGIGLGALIPRPKIDPLGTQSVVSA
jgi:hypothetical protein